MKKRFDTRPQKRHHVRALLFASRKHTPEPLLPTVAPVASSPLRHFAVDHDLANCLFARIVCRWNLFLDKTKILFPPVPKSLGDVDRVLVRRNRAPRHLQDRIAMRLHLPTPNLIRTFVLSMNGRKHFLNFLQKTSAVTSRCFVLALGEKLHFADQMSPTELECRRGHSLELFVCSPKIARNRSAIIRAQNVFQHDAPTRRIDVKHRQPSRAKTPDPTPLAVLFASRFVDVNVRLVRQTFEKAFVRLLHRTGDFANLLGKKARRDFQRHRIGEKILQGFVRHVPATLEIRGQGDEFRSEKTGLLNVLRQVGTVETLTMFAPGPRLSIFGHDERLVDEFDLLMNFRRLGRWDEFSAATRTGFQIEFDDLVDLVFVERFSQISLVTFLSPAFALLAFVFRLGTLGRPDDVRRWRLRGVGRILFEHGNMFGQRLDKLFELVDLFFQSSATRFHSLIFFLKRKHAPCFTPFFSFHQYQFDRFMT